LQPHLLKKIDLFEINSPLLHYAKNNTSQFGEDGIIERIFEILGTKNQYCVEFGGWDGKYLSNCYGLVVNKGWSGCFIEANKKKFAELVVNHGANPKVNCVNKYVELCGQNSLESILNEVEAPRDIDLLSIDIDGLDYFIWEGLTSYLPSLLVIEFNPSVPNDVAFVQPLDAAVNQGASLLAFILLGKRKGYELICCTSCNAFFVKSDDYLKFDLKSNSIHTLYKPLVDGRIFHGFDSHVYTCGMERLLWSNISIDHNSFQVVPKNERNYVELDPDT